MIYKTLLIFIALVVAILIGFGCMHHYQYELIEIDKAIDLEKSSSRKRLLKDFKNNYQDADSILVTSHSAEYELIVSNKSTSEYTGGAEQYFMDKQTGKIRMGWHESPMKIQGEN